MDNIDISYLLFFFATLFFTYLLKEIYDIKKRIEKVEKMFLELQYDIKIIRIRYGINNPYEEKK